MVTGEITQPKEPRMTKIILQSHYHSGLLMVDLDSYAVLSPVLPTISTLTPLAFRLLPL